MPDSDSLSDAADVAPVSAEAHAVARAPRRRRAPVTPLQIESVPALRDPVLICAFGGWNDAAQSATGAVRYLIERFAAPRFAGIDPEEFYVFTETRPTVRLVDGLQRQLEWPANDFHYFRNTRAPRDLVLMAGAEPQLGWRAFTTTILDLAGRIKARLIVSLGGLLADVSYAQPVRLTGGVNPADALPGWPLRSVRTSRYEGPTGIVGVLADACRQMDIPSASIWANVPHYITVSPNPKTLSALVHQVDSLFNLDLDLGDLEQASDRFVRQVTEAIEQNPDVKRYVRQLEAAADDDESPAPAELPSGAAIVEELEEFLRQRHHQDEDDDE